MFYTILGQICSCLDPNGSTTSEELNILHRGGKFARSIYLGLSSQELFMELSKDNSTIAWKTLNSTSVEFGEIDLAGSVKSVRPQGHQGIQYIDNNGKCIFEVNADDRAVRDQWIVALNELLSSWNEDPSKRPHSTVSSKGTSNKAEYFKAREEELLRREQEAAERKKKYSAGGMKYTAMALANKS